MPPTDRITTRLSRGFKAVSQAPHPNYRETYGGYGDGIAERWLAGRLPDDFFTNRQRVGDGGFTGVVENTLAVKSRAFTEIRPQVGVINADDPEAPPEPDPSHPVNGLLERPNEAMTWTAIGEYLVAAMDVNGTALLVKVTGGPDGQPMSLWPLYPEALKPVSKGRDFLTYWEYTLEGQTTRLAPDDVILFRNRLNRADHRIGQSSLEPVLREVATDEEASKFASTILHNLGVPGVVLTARDQYNPPSQDQATATLRTWRDRFGGTRRGDPWIQSDYDISVVSFSPQQMDLRTLRQIPEERVTGALGVPAILAGMGAGLDRATYSNAAELRAFFTEQTLIPLWTNVADSLTDGLLGPDVLAGRTIYFDTTRVRALQEDRNEEADRIVTLVNGGILTVDEGRELIGYGPLPDVVDIDEGVGTAFVEGDPEDVELTDDETVPVEAGLIGFLTKSFDDDAWEDRYASRIGDVLAGWAAHFASEAGLVDDRNPEALQAIADRTIQSEELRVALQDLGVALIGDSATSSQAIPTKAATLDPDTVVAGMRRFVDQHSTLRAEQMSEWTRTRVRNIIAKGLDQGDDASTIAQGIERWVKNPARARVIATTEVTAARNGAADYAAQLDPRPMWKVWRVTRDGHARDDHANAGGQRVLEYETFAVGGWAMRFPGDPNAPAEQTINCRCRLEYRLATRTVGGYFGR